jgi:hypothetical protein
MPICITCNVTGMKNSGNEGALLCITLHYFTKATTCTSYMVWMIQRPQDKIVMALISQMKYKTLKIQCPLSLICLY